MVEFKTMPIPMESSILNRDPAVSIGMPVYNGAQYIREALDSLLSQTAPDFELIISDNASTDDTQSICAEYARCDPRIRYFRQVKNKGPVANFRFVLDCAKADLFMWAAYDDLWAPNFLMDAIDLLADKTIDFVFPTFELRSIRLRVAKKINPEIFKFIGSTNRRRRVLDFISLHFLSHSANIVYSLFRTNFLRAAWNRQDIENDGALGAVVLGLGRGITSNSLFSKRYPVAWPGMLPPVLSIINGWTRKRNVMEEAQHSIDAAKLKMLSHFPEYEQEIEFIFDRYRPYRLYQSYRVCSLDEKY